MRLRKFQHTAARRRLQALYAIDLTYHQVSTHSRTEAAAHLDVGSSHPGAVSTHSRTEAAALVSNKSTGKSAVSTHSRTEAAASAGSINLASGLFQHTAARRRLLEELGRGVMLRWVSTHSRTEAAAP